MADLKEALRGLARAMGPDVIGGPVDASQDLVNLLLAGGGTAAHKLGLISAEQLPQALSGSPGTSDWWAKQVKLEDRGAPEYTAGRLAPLAAAAGPAVRRGTSALVDALVAAPQGIEAQRGAIRVGGRQDLMPSHQTNLEALLQRKDAPLPQELYSPSIGISKDRLMENFGGGEKYGNFWAIPKVGAFDPAYSPSTLFNRDAYTPRHGDYQGRRADDWGRVKQMLAESQGTMGIEAGLPAMAERRLVERGIVRLPEGERRRNLAFGENEVKGSHGMAISASPHFRSFGQFERDPRGAMALDKRAQGGDSEYQASQLLASIQDRLPAGIIDPSQYSSLPDYVARLESLARQYPGKLGDTIKRALIEAPYAQREFARLPSEYAELKLQGPVQLNSERFAGLLLQPSRSMQEAIDSGDRGAHSAGEAFKTMLLQARHRNLPVQVVDPGMGYGVNLFELADGLQKRAGPVKDRRL